MAINMSIVTDLIDIISQGNDLQRKYIKKIFQLLTTSELQEFEKYIEYCQLEGKNLEYLADAYNILNRSALKEQIYFKKKNKYRYSSLLEVESFAQRDPQFFEKYMYGLSLSIFLWQQHIKIRRFFVDILPRVAIGNYIEIGPGHGYFLIKAMQICSYKYYEGIDISQTNADLTKKIIESKIWGKYSNYNIVTGDFTSIQRRARYDAVVLGEVLEHVENPTLLLNQISSISNNGAFIYISTCINSPMIDHIHLFRKIDDVETLFKENDLKIEKRMIAPYDEKTVDECYREQLPINVAYQLSVCKSRPSNL